jgi:hypothetical protein
MDPEVIMTVGCEREENIILTAVHWNKMCGPRQKKIGIVAVYILSAAMHSDL